MRDYNYEHAKIAAQFVVIRRRYKATPGGVCECVRLGGWGGGGGLRLNTILNNKLMVSSEDYFDCIDCSKGF